MSSEAMKSNKYRLKIHEIVGSLKKILNYIALEYIVITFTTIFFILYLYYWFSFSFLLRVVFAVLICIFMMIGLLQSYGKLDLDYWRMKSSRYRIDKIKKRARKNISLKPISSKRKGVQRKSIQSRERNIQLISRKKKLAQNNQSSLKTPKYDYALTNKRFLALNARFFETSKKFKSVPPFLPEYKLSDLLEHLSDKRNCLNCRFSDIFFTPERLIVNCKKRSKKSFYIFRFWGRPCWQPDGEWILHQKKDLGNAPKCEMSNGLKILL